jgi:Uma2 family endonuclease
MSLATPPAVPSTLPTPTRAEATSPSTPGPSTANPPASVVVVDRLYRLTVDQYHSMAEAGILGPDDRIELLEGFLVAKMTKNDPHLLATELTQEVFTAALPAGWYVSMQNPITIVETQSEPQPDAKVVRGYRRDYKGRRILPENVALVIEVSDSSVSEDQTTKKRLYALAAIPF